jgi:dTDP-4-amino-4,6-dideoxygalactose transaminase
LALDPRFTDDEPAIAGGRPAFPDGLRLVRPSIPDREKVSGALTRILDTGILTNGPYVSELERLASDYLGVSHCVAVSSCTAGLMLVLKASGLTGEVVLPSFTFAATAHAVAWNGLRPVFADIDARSLTLDPEAALKASGIRTSAILATHTFGTPCQASALMDAADLNGIKLFFDAAHAFGSSYHGMQVGRFGHAEVFSLSPTKVLVAGEGGIISTNDDVLAERCRIGRDYANPGDYDCLFVGLNARMSEIHAAIAILSLEGLDERVRRRNEIASLYCEDLSDVRGISFPEVPAEYRSTFKDFTILIDAEEFGMGAEELGRVLAAEGIETRRYYSPPVHRMKAYRFAGPQNDLPVTDRVSSQVLTLPLASDMIDEEIRGVARSIERIASWLGAGNSLELEIPPR